MAPKRKVKEEELSDDGGEDFVVPDDASEEDYEEEIKPKKKRAPAKRPTLKKKAAGRLNSSSGDQGWHVGFCAAGRLPTAPWAEQERRDCALTAEEGPAQQRWLRWWRSGGGRLPLLPLSLLGALSLRSTRGRLRFRAIPTQLPVWRPLQCTLTSVVPPCPVSRPHCSGGGGRGGR